MTASWSAAATCLEWRMGDLILDTYLVKPLEHLGRGPYAEGGMGRVYRVFHRGWGLDLAAKVPLYRLAGDDRLRQLLENECQQWVTLAPHPNVVSCHYIRRVADTPVLFAEFVEGGTLADWIEDGVLLEGGSGPALRRFFDIAIQMAWGLHHAHQQQLVHQDVKPSNIMMTKDGDPKLTDFGLAGARFRAAAGQDRPGGATSDELQATFRGGIDLRYCSPEQSRAHATWDDHSPRDEAPKLTRHSDMWSWAASVLEILMGERTWKSGLEAPDALSALRQSRPPERLPRPSPSLLSLLAVCFERDPGRRFKDMAEIAVALRGLYREEFGGDYPRPIPRLAKLRAGGFNNRALSMLDLGDEAAADRLFAQALAADRLNPEATYNRGLLAWRRGRWTDDALLTELRAVERNLASAPRPRALLGLVHAERGDRRAAIEALTAAGAGGEPDPLVAQALARLVDQPEEAGQCRRTMSGHEQQLTDLVLTRGGDTLLSSSFDHTIHLWRLRPPARTQVLRGHTDAVFKLAASADGRVLLSGGHDGALRLWDVDEGALRRVIEECHGKIWSVAISPDGKLGVAGTDDNHAWIYDLETGGCMRSLRGHRGVIAGIQFLPDGSSLVTASWDGTLCLWDLVSGRSMQSIDLYSKELRDLEISSDGRRALVACEDTTVQVVDLTSGERIALWQGHRGAVNVVTLSPDGRRALSGSSTDGTMRLWDSRSGRCLRTFDVKNVTSAVFSRDGGTAWFGGRSLQEWSLAVGSPSELALSQPQSAVKLSTLEAGQHRRLMLARRAIEKTDIALALQLIDEATQLGGARTRKTIDMKAAAGRRSRRTRLLSTLGEELPGMSGSSVTCLAIEGNDREARVHARAPIQLGCPPCEVCEDDFDRLALVGFRGGAVKIVSLRQHAITAALETQRSHVEAVSFLRGGMRAVVVTRSHGACVYDLANGECISHSTWIEECQQQEARDAAVWQVPHSFWFEECQQEARDVAGCRVPLHPENAVALGNQLRESATSWDRKRRLTCAGTSWGAANPLEFIEGSTAERRVLDAGDVSCVALMPDGRYGFSGGWHGEVKMWDLANREVVHSFAGPRTHITCITCSPDGRWLMAGGEDGLLRIWELVWEYDFPGWTESSLEADAMIDALVVRHGIESAESWTAEVYCRLVLDLQSVGLGYVQPASILARVGRGAPRPWAGGIEKPGVKTVPLPPQCTIMFELTRAAVGGTIRLVDLKFAGGEELKGVKVVGEGAVELPLDYADREIETVSVPLRQY